MRILVYEVWGSEGIVGIRNTDGKIIVSSDPVRLLEFLRYSSRDVVRAFWDLDSSLAPIFRLLPKPALERLAKFDEDLSVGDHQLYYLPDRSFRCGRSRYYSLRCFWPTKEPVPGTLESAQVKANELEQTLAQCGMGDFGLLTSPISVFEKTELGKEIYSRTPKGYEIHPGCFQAIEYASKCDKREWISAYQIGHWGCREQPIAMCDHYGTSGHPSFRPVCRLHHFAGLKCHSANPCSVYKAASPAHVPGDTLWDFDLGAAYPSVAADLLDLRDMEIWKSSSYGRRERGAYYGFLRGRLWLDPAADYIHCSPIMTDLDRLPGNPAGDFGNDYFLTLDELRLIERMDWGKFDFADGWFLSPLSHVNPRKPFRSIMDSLYEQRQHSDLASSIMKNVANQICGKLIETRVSGEYGVLRNDLYHSLVLAQTRIKVAEFLIQNGVRASELVCVQTDGVKTTKLISTPTNGGMGQWRCNGSQATIVASPYRVFVEDKRPGHLTYDSLVALIGARPASTYYGTTVKHRVTLRQAIQQGDIALVGQLADLPAHLDLVSLEREQNRKFAKLPKTGQALLSGRYQSEAVVL